MPVRLRASCVDCQYVGMYAAVTLSESHENIAPVASEVCKAVDGSRLLGLLLNFFPSFVIIFVMQRLSWALHGF